MSSTTTANASRLIKLDQPIFCLCLIKDFLIVASGGGGKKFGVRNKIVSYKIINNSKISEMPSHWIEFEIGIPVFISSLDSFNLFSTCMDNVTVMFKFNTRDGTFDEVSRIVVSNYYDTDVYQSVCRFDNKGVYLGTGTTDGVLK